MLSPRREGGKKIKAVVVNWSVRRIVVCLSRGHESGLSVGHGAPPGGSPQRHHTTNWRGARATPRVVVFLQSKGATAGRHGPTWQLQCRLLPAGPRPTFISPEADGSTEAAGLFVGWRKSMCGRRPPLWRELPALPAACGEQACETLPAAISESLRMHRISDHAMPIRSCSSAFAKQPPGCNVAWSKPVALTVPECFAATWLDRRQQPSD